MRFLGHLTVGVIAAAAIIALFGIKLETAFVSFAIVIGSIFPDIDHPFSYMRRAFVFAFFLMLTIFAYPFIDANKDEIVKFCKECSNSIIIAFIALIAAGILTLVVNFLIPFHRGPLHSILATIAFGIGFAFAATKFGLSPVIIGAAAATGYLLHLICDVGER